MSYPALPASRSAGDMGKVHRLVRAWRRLLIRSRLPIVLILSLTLLSACDRSASTSSSAQKVPVLATVYPLADVAKQVGGPFVDVSWVVESGQPIVNLDPGSAVRGRILSARIVLTGGATEPWVISDVGDPFQSQRLVRLDLLLSSQRTPAVGLLWLDPVIVQDAARELFARLLVLLPTQEKALRDRTNEFVSAIDGVLREYQPRFLNAQNRRILVLSTEFNALLLRFGLEPVLAVSAQPTQLNDQAIKLIKAAADERGTRLLIVPADTPAVVSRDLQVRGGLQIVPIDRLGSSAAGGRNTYIDLLRYNLDQLWRATTVR